MVHWELMLQVADVGVHYTVQTSCCALAFAGGWCYHLNTVNDG
jgi:hypothetical protein